MTKQLTLEDVIKIVEMDKSKEIFGLEKLPEELLVKSLKVELGKSLTYSMSLEYKIDTLERRLKNQEKQITNLKKSKKDEVVNKRDSVAYQKLLKHCKELELTLSKRRDELLEINHELSQLRFLTNHIE